MSNGGEEVAASSWETAGMRFERKLLGVDEAFVEADNKEVGPEFMKVVCAVGKGVSFK